MAGPGRYYVFEGADYSGKTTQQESFAKTLRAMGETVRCIREPGTTGLAELIRNILLHNQEPLQPESEFYLFTAARCQLKKEIIEPEITRGVDVVSDRSWMSSAVYQGYAGGVDLGHILDVSHLAMGDYFIPDGAVIIDVPADVLLARIPHDSTLDRFEGRENGFMRKVVEGYRWLAKEVDVKLIDGNRTITEVQDDVNRHFGSVKGVRRS